MAIDTVTIEQFVKDNAISISSKWADRNPHMDGSESMDNWKVTLKSKTARMTLHYSKGIGHHGAEPTADEVLDCLASDASGLGNSPDFESWCSEYGYDVDSRKAERTFKAIKHQSNRLKKFLGEDLFEQLLWHTERK